MNRDPRDAVRLSHVVKRFGVVVALAGVSLSIRAGEVVAILGPNGAGKTTALRIMLGLRRPDDGVARLFGDDPRAPQARLHVGATPQDLDFPGTLRVRELLVFAARHFPRPLEVGAVLEQFGLDGLARRQAGGLSGGQRRRLAVALAFVGTPKAVFLDEPTASLDVESRRTVWDVVRRFSGEGGTVVLTTHSLEEAQALASRIVVIAGGRIVGDGTASSVSAQLGAESLEEALLALVGRSV
jgi:ABC-2 type transport system ATP-binding protein